jgi:glutathione S-transferase
MLELYTHPMSPCAQKVRITLAEKGLEWTAHHVELQQKENLKPEYLKLNPAGVVPTLVDNGMPIVESSLICEYLDEAYPETPLRPDDAKLRHEIRLWMKHVDNKLHPSCGAIQWPLAMRDALLEKSEEERQALLEKIPEKPRRERQKRLLKHGLDAPDVADAVKVYHKTIVDMEKALADSDWIVGDSYSLADIIIAPYFQTLHQYHWTEMYEKDFPRVTDWYARIRARDSYQTGVASDFSDEKLAELKAKGIDAWPKIKAHLDTL